MKLLNLPYPPFFGCVASGVIELPSRASLVRLTLIALSFVSVSTTLSALPMAVSSFWYLYFSPVLVAALSFGLRGALIGSIATFISLTVLLSRLQQLLALASQDLILRLAILGGTVYPDLRALGGTAAPAQTEGTLRDALTSFSSIEGFGVAVMQVGLGSICIALGACLVGLYIDRERGLTAALRQQARTDPLTRLANHGALMEGIEQAVRVATPFSLLLIDLDRFKLINDRYGHLVGDQALRHIAAALTGLVRTREDIAGRYGGDEFVVLLKHADVRTAEQVSTRLSAWVVEHPLVISGREPVPVPLSVGVATFPNDGTNVEAIFRAADHAMYAAKRLGTIQSGEAENHPFLGSSPG